MLTLRKLLETVADYDRPVEIAIETKHPTRYGGLVERRLVEMLRDFGWDRRRRAGPGDELLLHRPAAGAAAGAGRPAGDADRQGAPLADAAAGDRRRTGSSGPGIERAPRPSAASAERLVTSGRDIHVWTVNTAERPRSSASSSGCKAVITDRPAYVLELLGRSSLPAMGKRSRTKARDHVVAAGRGRAAPALPVRLGPALQGLPRRPRPVRRRCTSAGRSRACRRECDVVALRELVPAATAPLTLKDSDRDRSSSARCCRWRRPAMVRDSGEIWLGPAGAAQLRRPGPRPRRRADQGARRRARHRRPDRPAGRRAAAAGPGHRVRRSTSPCTRGSTTGSPTWRTRTSMAGALDQANASANPTARLAVGRGGVLDQRRAPRSTCAG